MVIILRVRLWVWCLVDRYKSVHAIDIERKIIKLSRLLRAAFQLCDRKRAKHSWRLLEKKNNNKWNTNRSSALTFGQSGNIIKRSGAGCERNNFRVLHSNYRENVGKPVDSQNSRCIVTFGVSALGKITLSNETEWHRTVTCIIVRIQYGGSVLRGGN